MATVADLFALALRHHQAGNLSEAEQLYLNVLRFNPDFSQAHNNLGNILLLRDKPGEAVACYREALRINPNFAEAYHGLGNAFERQNQFDDALRCYEQGLLLNPDLAEGYNNVGTVLSQKDKFSEAVPYFEEAIRRKPNFAEAHNNLGVAYKAQGLFDEALACCERALHGGLCYPEAHLNRAILWLLRGNWRLGWPEYEWRLRTKQPSRPELTQPRWDGSDLNGRTLVVFSEQGLGDTIHFIRYASLVKERGGKVIFECQPALMPLLANVQGIDQLLSRGSALPSFDVHAPLLSLPGILHTEPDTVPAAVSYLQANDKLVGHWRKELEPLRGFKIGIAWKGSPTHGYDRLRSVPLSHFAPLAKVPGVQLVSLQKRIGTDQLHSTECRFPVVDLGQRLDEESGAFMDTAAIMMNLDLVISSDTAVPHLAGALGVPVWVALPWVPDWRWLLEREDSPWYPTMRLFRQTRFGDWDGVFDRMAEELTMVIHGLSS
jgi:Flp pilus assembly protein TadD